MLEVIRSRRSVRTFDGTQLKTEDAQKILEFAEKVENPYDIHITWKILDAEKYGLTSPVILGTNTYIAGKMRRVPHAEEAFGYTFEKVVLYAQSIGVSTTWIAGTMNRPAFEKAIDLKEDEVMPCVSPLGYVAKKMALREVMMRKGIKADTRFDFKELFFKDSFDNPMTEADAGKLKDVFEAIRWAPSAVNKQPWRLVVSGNKVHFYEKHSKGYVNEVGWDIQRIDMGIALCHFEIMAKECGLDVFLTIEEPSIPMQDEMNYIATYIIK